MAKRSYPRPLWRFRCEADQIADNRYRIELASDTGHRITREGYHPLHELIRALGIDAKAECPVVSDTATSGWIACTDRLPDSDATVLIHSPEASEPVQEGFIDGYTADNTPIWSTGRGYDVDNVTHWMHLPQPPEVTK